MIRETDRDERETNQKQHTPCSHLQVPPSFPPVWTQQNQHDLSLAITPRPETIRSRHKKEMCFEAETNKFREKKLDPLLHCSTPPRTPQFFHYTPLECTSTDKRAPAAQVIGNQVSVLMACYLPSVPPAWAGCWLGSNQADTDETDRKGEKLLFCSFIFQSVGLRWCPQRTQSMII